MYNVNIRGSLVSCNQDDEPWHCRATGHLWVPCCTEWLAAFATRMSQLNVYHQWRDGGKSAFCLCFTIQ